MARYLVVEPGEVPVIHEAEAKNIHRLIENLTGKIGDSVQVWRIADGPKHVQVKSETVKRIEIS